MCNAEWLTMEEERVIGLGILYEPIACSDDVGFGGLLTWAAHSVKKCDNVFLLVTIMLCTQLLAQTTRLKTES